MKIIIFNVSVHHAFENEIGINISNVRYVNLSKRDLTDEDVLSSTGGVSHTLQFMKIQTTREMTSHTLIRSHPVTYDEIYQRCVQKIPTRHLDASIRPLYKVKVQPTPTSPKYTIVHVTRFRLPSSTAAGFKKLAKLKEPITGHHRILIKTHV